MGEIDYSAAGVEIRADLDDAHRLLWQHLASSGTWWSGAERVAIAAESRAAERCWLCSARKKALSPNAVAGRHDAFGSLGDGAVEAAHRLRTDPGRLSRAWYDEVRAAGLEEGPYVELVAVVAMTAGVDAFARSLGVPPPPLAEPRPGAPTRYRPATAKRNGAWVATIAAAEASGDEIDLYGGAAIVPNIASALSLVPAEARTLRRLMEPHYMSLDFVPDPTHRRGALDRAQMELVAARVSALNQCFY